MREDYQKNNTILYNVSTFLVQGPNSYRKYGRFKGTVSAEKPVFSLPSFWANDYVRGITEVDSIRYSYICIYTYINCPGLFIYI